MFDDDSPYLLRDGGHEHPTSVEIPFAWHMDDAPFSVQQQLPGRSIARPSAVLETWTLEFDQLSRERPDRCLVSHAPRR